MLSAQVAKRSGSECQLQDEGLSTKRIAVHAVEAEALIKRVVVQPEGTVAVILSADCDQSVRETLSLRILSCSVVRFKPTRTEC